MWARCLRCCTALVLLAGAPDSGDAQDRVVLRGTVVHDETRVPVPGAQVVAPLSELSAVTDSLGHFEISFIRDTHYELVTAAIGYAPTRVTLGPEAEHATIELGLEPDEEALASLEVLHDGLEDRRRLRRTRRLELIEHVELGRSDAENAYNLVRDLTSAQPCEGLEHLCRLGRRVQLCIDDNNLHRGARELEAYAPSDLWLIEVYREGREIRVYSRWFIDDLIRRRQGEIRRIPMC